MRRLICILQSQRADVFCSSRKSKMTRRTNKVSTEIACNADDRKLLLEINAIVKSFQDQIQTLNDELASNKRELKEIKT